MHAHIITQMLRTLRPVLRDNNRAKQILEKYWSDKIALIWELDDVFRAANEKELALTKEEAKKILRELHDHHNKQYGIRWEDIPSLIQEYGIGRDLTKRELHQFIHKDIITINTKRKEQ